MSDADETFLKPDAARAGAQRLGVAGATLASRWAQHAATISSLNASAPWGTDEPGQGFNKHYLEGGDKAPATSVLSGGKTIVDLIKLLGPDVLSAVDGTVEVDDMVDKWFGGEGK
ncbi:hypothetical protein [Micromonospora sp. NPDC005203]|uniref:hypothetical protein n=1 Tax=Micromonospora sp. NPDC005203 TaxID=3364226 RepID=UPI003673B9DC